MLLSSSLLISLLMKLVFVSILPFALVLVLLLSLELFILTVCRNLDTLEKDLPMASEARIQQSEPQWNDIHLQTPPPISPVSSEGDWDDDILLFPMAGYSTFADSAEKELWLRHQSLQNTLDAYNEALEQLTGRIDILARDQAELKRLEARIPQDEFGGDTVLFDFENEMDLE
ncbi:hypothetical protein E4T47_00860 [Aureobasidium subglaciale]|nr:hypothetical protein E4T47_00860 [Aureobasidium subglaciale]